MKRVKAMMNIWKYFWFVFIDSIFKICQWMNPVAFYNDMMCLMKMKEKKKPMVHDICFALRLFVVLWDCLWRFQMKFDLVSFVHYLFLNSVPTSSFFLYGAWCILVFIKKRFKLIVNAEMSSTSHRLFFFAFAWSRRE